MLTCRHDETLPPNLHWPAAHLPLLLLLEPGALALAPRVERAIRWWEARRAAAGLTPARYFVYGGEAPALVGGPGVVVIGWDLTECRGAACDRLAHTPMRLVNGQIVAAAIRINWHTQEALLDRAIAHELGHLQGLDHSPDPRDVMYEMALGGDYGWTPPVAG